MNKNAFGVLIALAFVNSIACGGSNNVTTPTPIPTTTPTSTLTILSVTPAAGSTIDHGQAPFLAKVHVEYERSVLATSTRLTVCLGRTVSTFLSSSCRDLPLSATRGEADGYPGISWMSANGIDVVAYSETGFVVAFLRGTGDLINNRRPNEEEVAIDRLSSGVVAALPVEHLLYWR